jgi:L-cysteine desulfidase
MSTPHEKEKPAEEDKKMSQEILQYIRAVTISIIYFILDQTRVTREIM